MVRSFLQIAVIGLFLIGLTANAQIQFASFDTLPDSTDFHINFGSVSDTSSVTLISETGTVHEGSGAMRADWRVERAESWGGFAKWEYWHADSQGVFDLSPYENLSIWYYNDAPSTDPGRIHFRIQLFDVSDVPVDTYDGGNLELWYSFEYILDDPQGWTEIVLPLEDIGPDAQSGTPGFWRTGWSGVSGNDHLDLDKIKGFGFEISIDAPQDFSVHTGSIIFDDWQFQGARALPVVFFNGRVIPSDLVPFSFDAALSVAEGAGFTPGTNALQWSQNGGAAYPGFGFEMPVKNLSLRWMTDSLKFKIKAPSGVGTLRVEFEDAFGTKIKEEIPEPGSGYNDTWMDMAIPLRDIDTYQAGSDFDTTQVKFMIMLAEGTGNGSTILFDDMWTGNPDIDVIPPSAPTSLFVVPDNQNNVVTWVDSPNETGETYTIYYSRNPIVATLEGTKYRGVEVVDRGFNLSEGSGQYPHLLLSPVADSTTNYYYAVTATDAAGNESNPVVSATPVSNTSRGVTTVSLVAPTNFVADGNAGDWGSRTAFRVALSAGARVATNTTVDNDADLSMDAYLAIDSDYLYFFLDIEDDVVDTTAGNTWEKDSPDLFIGLYDFHGMPHSGGLQRGGEPDYQFRFLPSKAIIDNIGAATAVSASSGDYFWAETFPTGYVIEGRVALADLATIGNDTPFSPSEGVRIPFDFALNDADAGNGTREGIMAWSPYNDDSGYQSPSYWLYNWIGNRENILAIEDVDPIVADRFVLEQNYPNPFNPTTTIVYNLAKQSSVKLSVFNSLGQKVAELVDENQSAGRYTVKLDGSSLASGIYFYQLQAGSFSQVRKMILLK